MARNEPAARAAADVAAAPPEPDRAREPVREPELGPPVEGDHHRAAEADQRARQLRPPAGLAELHHLLPVECNHGGEIAA